MPAPYAGSIELGYKLAEYSLGQLVAGFNLSNISSGSIPFSPPPNGTWVFTLLVTEYIAPGIDDGFFPDDYFNFSAPVTFGPPPPPPPALTPPVGLWWNPSESGSGYAFDYKHGVLVVTVYFLRGKRYSAVVSRIRTAKRHHVHIDTGQIRQRPMYRLRLRRAPDQHWE